MYPIALKLLQPNLTSICVKSTSEEHGSCFTGMAPLFTLHTIEAAHHLLFITAIMHILVTCTSFYLTLIRVS